MFRKILSFSFLIALLAAPAMAAEGMATPWQLGFQDSASPVMEELDSMHSILLVVITAITIFVIGLTLYICVRFNRRANPVPSTNSHNTLLEVVWTVIPIIILVGIAIPSLRLHTFMNGEPPEVEMTLKVIGYQWYWNYEYPDHGGFSYDSYMKPDADLKEGEPRLLAVDNNVVVPVDTVVRVQLTGGDVIHSWAVPALGVKRDSMPGRLNETWFKATKTGTYYGQCSELCGIKHGFMPIAVEVVEKEQFQEWVTARKEEAGIVDEVPEEVAEEAPEVTMVY